MRDKRVYEIAVIAVFVAMIIMMALVPMLGFIQIGAVALTIIHIPVLIGGIFGGRKVAFSLGLTFGLMSFIIALTRPTGPIDVLFQNPLVSVLPRALFGLVIYDLYVWFNKVIPEPYTATTISLVVSTILHSIFVLVPLFLFGGGAEFFGAAIVPFIWGVMLTNGFFEALLAGLVGGPVSHRLRQTRQLN